MLDLGAGPCLTEYVLSKSATQTSTGVPHVSTRPTFYVPQLDGLRFVAFFLVFLHHNLPVGVKLSKLLGSRYANVLDVARETSGFGLSLFFFLSAYLIGSLLILEKTRTNTVHLRAFYVRRILRIWPLYFGFLAGVSVFGLWLPAEHLSLARLAAMTLLVGNWYTSSHGLGPFVIGPLWSISVEEQFYAIWPSVFRSLSQKNFTIFAVIATCVSLGVTGYLADGRVNTGNIWLNSFAELIFFAGGTLLALYFKASRTPNVTCAVLAISGGVFLWTAAEIWCKVNDRVSHPSALQLPFGYFLVACGCALLLGGVLLLPVSSFPNWLIYLGKISYGLYVFHALAMHIVRSTPATWHLRAPGIDIFVVLSLTILCASLSYPLIERPFLRLKRRFESVRTRSA